MNALNQRWAHSLVSLARSLAHQLLFRSLAHRLFLRSLAHRLFLRSLARSLTDFSFARSLARSPTFLSLARSLTNFYFARSLTRSLTNSFFAHSLARSLTKFFVPFWQNLTQNVFKKWTKICFRPDLLPLSTQEPDIRDLILIWTRFMTSNRSKKETLGIKS